MTPEELEVEALKLATRNCGGDPRIPREKTIELMELENGKWSLAAFFAMFNKACEDVPPEFRAAIIVEAQDVLSEDSNGIQLKVFYSRPETQQEVETRAGIALASARHRIAAAFSSSEREVSAVIASLASKGVSIDEAAARDALTAAKRGCVERPATVTMPGGYRIDYPNGPIGPLKIMST